MEIVRRSKKTQLYHERSGLTNQISATGALFVAELQPMFQAVFLSPLSAFQWTQTVANNGTIVTENGVVTLSTGTTANGSAKLISVKRARYYGAQPNRYIAGIILGDTGGANNIRRWGAFDDNNGVFFELNGTTLRIVTRNTGVDTAVTSFNGPATFVLDTNFHTYTIDYTASNAMFYVDGFLIHTVTPNTGTALVAGPTVPANIQNINSGGSTTNRTIGSRGLAVQRHGWAEPRSFWIHTSTVDTAVVVKNGPGTLKRVIVGYRASGASHIVFYDGLTTSAPVITQIDMQNVLGTIELELDYDNGLTYSTTGSGFHVTIVYD